MTLPRADLLADLAAQLVARPSRSGKLTLREVERRDRVDDGRRAPGREEPAALRAGDDQVAAGLVEAEVGEAARGVDERRLRGSRDRAVGPDDAAERVADLVDDRAGVEADAELVRVGEERVGLARQQPRGRRRDRETGADRVAEDALAWPRRRSSRWRTRGRPRCRCRCRGSRRSSSTSARTRCRGTGWRPRRACRPGRAPACGRWRRRAWPARPRRR